MTEKGIIFFTDFCVFLCFFLGETFFLFMNCMTRRISCKATLICKVNDLKKKQNLFFLQVRPLPRPLKFALSHRGASRGRDEGGEYWEAPPIDSSPSATQSPTLTVVSVAQPTTLTVVPASAQPPTLSMVGDFVDEDGNPCSNV